MNEKEMSKCLYSANGIHFYNGLHIFGYKEFIYLIEKSRGNQRVITIVIKNKKKLYEFWHKFLCDENFRFKLKKVIQKNYGRL